MARRQVDVEASLAASIIQINPNNDVQDGPIPDVFIIPQAAEISYVEQKIDDLGRRYSADYVKTLGRSDVTLYGANHGLRINQGGAATGFAVYFRSSRPPSGRTFPVEAGSIVTSDDGSLSYVTTQRAEMNGDNADVYFNSSRRRYELQVPIQALGIGSEYEVPPGRIRNMGTATLGFDGVTQVARVTGGAPSQTNAGFMDLVRSRLEGSALGSLAGLETIIREYARGEISDLSTVSSTDIYNFRRRPRRAACDIWLVGSRSAEQTDTFTTGVTGVTDFILTKQPATSVIAVAVNGTNVEFDFVEDTDEITMNSVRGRSRISLVSPAAGGSIVSVRYNYNSLIEAVQNYVDGRSTATQSASSRFKRQPRLYDVDALVREAIAVPVNVSVSITVLSSYNEQSAQASSVDAIKSTVDTKRFESQLMPENTRAAIGSAAIGVSAVRMHEFARADRASLRVEAIEFRPYEYPTISDENITVSVRTA